MIKYGIYSIFAIGMFSLAGCLGSKENKPVFRLVDVNEPIYYQDAHIAGAINVPYDKLEAESKNWNKDDTIVMYCTDYLCSESTRLAKKLLADNFKNVSVYKGGIHEWYQLSLKDPKKYGIIGEATKKYLQRPIEKMAQENNGLAVLSADELSQLIVTQDKK